MATFPISVRSLGVALISLSFAQVHSSAQYAFSLSNTNISCVVFFSLQKKFEALFGEKLEVVRTPQVRD